MFSRVEIFENKFYPTNIGYQRDGASMVCNVVKDCLTKNNVLVGSSRFDRGHAIVKVTRSALAESAFLRTLNYDRVVM